MSGHTYGSVLVPIQITDEMLSSSSRAEDDFAAWSAATNYGTTDADRVIGTTTHRIYQSVRASNLNHNPEDPANRAGDAPWWVEVGPTSRWAMFDSMVSTATEVDETLTVVIRPGSFNAFDLRGLFAETIQVTVKDGPGGAVVWSYIGDLEDSAPPDYYEHFFAPFRPKTDFIATGIPPYRDMELSITLSASSGPVRCGMLSVGDLRPLGRSILGGKVKPKTYSYIKTDEFGKTEIRKRHSSIDLSFTVLLDQSEANAVMDVMTMAQDVPCVWVAATSAERAYLRAFGLASAELTDEHQRQAQLSINVQGFI